jgi:hypothetical protein
LDLLLIAWVAVGVFFFGVPFEAIEQVSPGETGGGKPALTEGRHLEVLGQGIDGLGSHPVQTDGKLKDVGIVLRSGIDDRNTIDYLAQRDTPAEVPDPYQTLLIYRDIYPLAGPHDELIDRVVDDFLQQDVDAVILIGTIAEPADVHPRPLPDVFQRAQGLYLAFVVIMGRYIHISAIRKGVLVEFRTPYYCISNRLATAMNSLFGRFTLLPITVGMAIFR